MTETRPATTPGTSPKASKASRSAEPSTGRVGLVRFYRQVVSELRKVVWPTRQQLSTYFVVVLVFVVFVVAFVSLLDLGFGTAVLKLLG